VLHKGCKDVHIQKVLYITIQCLHA